MGFDGRPPCRSIRVGRRTPGVVKHGIATSSGTAGLHTALIVAGVEPGDEVLVSSLTFIAPANAIRYAGAIPVFIDAEPKYWQMDPNLVEEFLTERCESRHGSLVNRSTGRPVRRDRSGAHLWVTRWISIRFMNWRDASVSSSLRMPPRLSERIIRPGRWGGPTRSRSTASTATRSSPRGAAG